VTIFPRFVAGRDGRGARRDACDVRAVVSMAL
jgi:hypothetical protein